MHLGIGKIEKEHSLFYDGSDTSKINKHIYIIDHIIDDYSLSRICIDRARYVHRSIS